MKVYCTIPSPVEMDKVSMAMTGSNTPVSSKSSESAIDMLADAAAGIEQVQPHIPSMMRGLVVPEISRTPSISPGAKSIAMATPGTESEMEVDTSQPSTSMTMKSVKTEQLSVIQANRTFKYDPSVDPKAKEREFICEIPFGCGNFAQYSLKESRKCVSDFFGRNKSCTKLIEQPITWCRAHYQQKGYHKRTWRFERLRLVSEQFRRIEKQEPTILYTLVPIKGEAERTLRILEKGEDIPIKETTHGRGQYCRAPRWALERIFHRFVGENLTMKDCFEFLAWTEKHMRIGHIKMIPQIEFLPQFQACSIKGNNRLGMCGPQKELLALHHEVEEKNEFIDFDSDSDNISIEGDCEEFDEDPELDENTLDDNDTSETATEITDNDHNTTLDLDELNKRLYAIAEAGFSPTNDRASAAKKMMLRSRIQSRTKKTTSSPESLELPRKIPGSSSINAACESDNLQLNKPRAIAKPQVKNIRRSGLINNQSSPPVNPLPDGGLNKVDLNTIRNYTTMSLGIVHGPGLEQDNDAAYLRGILQTLTFAIDSIVTKKGLNRAMGQ